MRIIRPHRHTFIPETDHLLMLEIMRIPELPDVFGSDGTVPAKPVRYPKDHSPPGITAPVEHLGRQSKRYAADLYQPVIGRLVIVPRLPDPQLVDIRQKIHIQVKGR